MKVWLVDGGTVEHGGTERALSEMARTLEAEGVETERYWVGAKPIRGCMQCGRCTRLQGCIHDPAVRDFVPHVAEADGFVFGAPARLGRLDSQLIEFLDQLIFWECRENAPSLLPYKPVVAVANVRGPGGCSFKTVERFFAARKMAMVGAAHKPIVRGGTAQEVERDAAGLAALRENAHAMATDLRAIESARRARVPAPKPLTFDPMEPL